MVINESMHEIERIFFESATEKGLRVTGQAYQKEKGHPHGWP